MTDEPRATKIGVLLVHGVGEQRRFEHLEGEVREVVRALRELPGVEAVSVATRTSADAAYLSEQVLWRADDGAPVQVQVRRANAGPLVLEFREVWWADIDERSSLFSQVRFWLWGLAQWAVVGSRTSRQLTDFSTMKLPGPPSGKRGLAEWLSIRGKLFLIAIFFCLVLLTLSLINFVLTKFLKGRLPGPDIIASYVGDVKLLLQERREGHGPIYDLGLPPRASVRRRIVKGLVEMALTGYDRWYVAAHSLGTVVALNGLMETELALPNYLDEATWLRCKEAQLPDAKGVAGPLGRLDVKEGAKGKIMMPRRPVWLEDHGTIDRTRLFGGLRGLLTYGSPLDKFSAMWPQIVALNPQPAFAEDFEWINVFDETDPVSGPLDDYGEPQPPDGSGAIQAAPKNFAFSAYPWLLLSHLKYLAFKSADRSRLVDRLAAWLVVGDRFPAPDAKAVGWQADNLRWGRYLGHFVQWACAFAFLSWLLGWVLSKLGAMLSQSFESVDLPQVGGVAEWTILGLSVSVSLVLLAGVVRLLGAGSRPSMVESPRSPQGFGPHSTRTAKDSP